MFDREAAKREAIDSGEFMIFLMKEKGLSKSFMTRFREECTHNVNVISKLPETNKKNYIYLCLMQYIIKEIDILIESQEKIQPSPMNRMR